MNFLLPILSATVLLKIVNKKKKRRIKELKFSSSSEKIVVDTSKVRKMENT